MNVIKDDDASNKCSVSSALQNKTHFKSIQLLRVCSCLGVFLVHFGQRTNLSGIIRSITDLGKYGVVVFFIISGFLATYSLNLSGDSPIIYYKKRAIQILPLYYLVIVWYFISENILNCFCPSIPTDDTGLRWLRYIFLLNGFVNSDTYFWNNLGITWTIPIFVFFYFIAPFAVKAANSFARSVVFCALLYIVANCVGYIYAEFKKTF